MLSVFSCDIQVSDEYGFLVQPLVDGKPFQEYCPKGVVENCPISGQDIHHNHAMTVFDLPIRSYTNEAVVLVCGCGEWGCSNNSVTMQANEATVTWANLKTHPSRPETTEVDFDSLEFDRIQYESVLRDVHANYLDFCVERHKSILLPLEQAHLDHVARGHLDDLTELLHSDFTGIAASGRVYSGQNFPSVLNCGARAVDLEVIDYSIQMLPPSDAHSHVVRAQYILKESQSDGTTYCSHRTTIWQNDWLAGKWRMLFHQGTFIRTE